MFKKVYTQQYPFDFYPTQPRYHGRHVLNRHPDGLEKCVGCELCAWACPADAIYVEGGDNTETERYSPGERYGAVYQINYLRCIFCGLCIEACPTRSLTMSNEYELALDNRQELIYTKEQLMAPLLPGMEAPPHPMRLGDDEKDYYTVESQAPLQHGEPMSAANVAGKPITGTAVEVGRHHWLSATLLAAGELAHGTVPLGEAIAFWVLGPVSLAGAIGTVLLRNAIHSALSLVATMMSLGTFYLIEQGPFLGLVQIIVYTGAIMILFLFVLMLVGRDSSDSLVETLRGQRWAAALFGVGFALLVAHRRRTRGRGHQTGRPGRAERGRVSNVNVDRRAAVHPLPVRVRADVRTADRGRRGRDGARAHRTRRARSATQKALARERIRSGRPQPLPGRACCRPATPSARPRCCRTARISRESVMVGAERASRRRASTASSARDRGASCERASEARHESDLLPGARPPRCSRSARSACSSGATRSSCSCASN